MGYDRILVAIDASALQAAVYQQALETAKLHQAELKLLHCVEGGIDPAGASTIAPAGTSLDTGYLFPSAADFDIAQQAWDAQLTNAKRWLREFCQTAEQQGITATFEAEGGNPGHQVCDLARDWQADLIVVGRHGRTGLTELLLGSVSNHIVHHAPCAVLVIQGATITADSSP
ncbi:universal stress protein [Acaryochloris sp. IP29b_bin.137]|uniref:universal stress protein n=1 Tax=Acaryochloris sp. IP29b_bin.137 TaxID=2969217 RepID=UPI0026159564|nr:universal stress protein [Acaryochloris sp. IP29b_bin.137]